MTLHGEMCWRVCLRDIRFLIYDFRLMNTIEFKIKSRSDLFKTAF